MAPSPSREIRCVAADAVDTLLSLPPQMLDEILSRLPIRDAVRTSALSRSWRHRWEALPSIDLTWPAQHAVAHEAVEAVLRRYAGRVRCFSALVGKGSAHSIGVWFRKLASRGIESLHLDGSYSFPLHASVFALASLTSLELCQCRVPALPDDFTGFPNLTHLKLLVVEFPAGSEHLQDIIAKSPLIENLYLIDTWTRSDTINLWVIQAPNLRRLRLISSNDYGWILDDFPLLDHALINLGKYLSGRDFGMFLGKLCHAKRLEIYTCNSKPPHAQAILETLPCIFDNLKILRLNTHFLDMPNILSSFCILRNAPNLEKLQIEAGAEEPTDKMCKTTRTIPSPNCSAYCIPNMFCNYVSKEKIMIDSDEKQIVEANADFQNKQWSDSMFANLQEVELNYIGCFSNEMSFIELILSKARLLRRLSIRLGVECLIPKEEVLDVLSKYSKASPNVEVTIEDFHDWC